MTHNYNTRHNSLVANNEENNHLKQYGKRNKLEITRIPDDVSDENLEENVIQVLSEIQVSVSSFDVEACKSKSKNLSKNNCTIY